MRFWLASRSLRLWRNTLSWARPTLWTTFFEWSDSQKTDNVQDWRPRSASSSSAGKAPPQANDAAPAPAKKTKAAVVDSATLAKKIAAIAAPVITTLAHGLSEGKGLKGKVPEHYLQEGPKKLKRARDVQGVWEKVLSGAQQIRMAKLS